MGQKPAYQTLKRLLWENLELQGETVQVKHND